MACSPRRISAKAYAKKSCLPNCRRRRVLVNGKYVYKEVHVDARGNFTWRTVRSPKKCQTKKRASSPKRRASSPSKRASSCRTSRRASQSKGRCGSPGKARDPVAAAFDLSQPAKSGSPPPKKRVRVSNGGMYYGQVRAPKALTEIMTIANGETPFRIALDQQNKTFQVFGLSPSAKDMEYDEAYKKGLYNVLKLDTTRYESFFPLRNNFGYPSTTWPSVFGAVFLLSSQSANKYMYVCDSVYTFELPLNNPLVHVFGEIGPSAVVYMLGLTQSNQVLDLTSDLRMTKMPVQITLPITEDKYRDLLQFMFDAPATIFEKLPNLSLAVNRQYYHPACVVLFCLMMAPTTCFISRPHCEPWLHANCS